MGHVGTNIARVRERIAAAAVRVGRRTEDITLVAVSKGISPAFIVEAINAGVTDIGESRIHEAEPKVQVFPDLRWHMVGHLQRNKVRQAVHLFSVVQSVDSERLAAELSSRGNAQRPIDVLLQVNVAGDPRKFGIDPGDALSILPKIARLPSLRLIGLMTIAPQANDSETVRPIFRRLRELRDRVRASGVAGSEFAHLSMGMTDDFEVAIEEGATMVRVGRAIFGERQ